MVGRLEVIIYLGKENGTIWYGIESVAGLKLAFRLLDSVQSLYICNDRSQGLRLALSLNPCAALMQMNTSDEDVGGLSPLLSVFDCVNKRLNPSI